MLVNDLMLFCVMDLIEVEKLKACLDKYKFWPRKKMNKAKSSVFGSRNAPKEMTMDLGNILGVNRVSATLEYHGLVGV